MAHKHVADAQKPYFAAIEANLAIKTHLGRLGVELEHRGRHVADSDENARLRVEARAWWAFVASLAEVQAP